MAGAVQEQGSAVESSGEARSRRLEAALRCQEIEVAARGKSPAQVLEELTQILDLEFQVRKWSKSSPSGEKEIQACGGSITLELAKQNIEGARFPTAVLGEMAKKLSEAIQQNKGDRREEDGPEKETKKKEQNERIGGLKAMEEALNILNGGEIAKIQAWIFKTTGKILWFIPIGTDESFLIGSEEDFERVNKSPRLAKALSFVTSVELVKKIEGTKKEVLKELAAHFGVNGGESHHLESLLLYPSASQKKS